MANSNGKWPWKILAIFLVISLILMGIAEYEFMMFTKIVISYSKKREALLVIKNQQVQHEVFRLTNYRKGRITKNNTPLFAVNKNADNFEIILTDTLTINIEDVFIQINKTMNGQAFTIFNRYSKRGIRLADDYYAVLADRIVLLEPGNEETAFTIRTSCMPDSCIFNPRDNEDFVLGYVNEGDLLTISSVELLKQLSWWSSKKQGWSMGLNGSNNRSPAAENLVGWRYFPAPHLPIGALLIKLPGLNWEILDTAKSWNIKTSGEVYVKVNSQQGGAHMLSGAVRLDGIMLTTKSQSSVI